MFYITRAVNFPAWRQRWLQTNNSKDELNVFLFSPVMQFFSWLVILIWKVFSRQPSCLNRDGNIILKTSLGTVNHAWWLGNPPEVSHISLLPVCYMSTVWYNFSLSESYKDQSECICLCAFTILPDFMQRVEEELKIQCQNFDKQGLSAMQAVGKKETKNLGLDFYPSLIWQ